MTIPQITSIGLFIDGGYYEKINEGLRKENLVLDLGHLMKYIQVCIGKKYGIDHNQCLITESHFYKGRYRVRDAKARNKLEKERRFEDTLIENDVVFHYKHIHELADGTIREKGVDVWFALETYELAMYRDFDFVVLITGDADHEMLARKIKALKKNVVLVTWNFAEKNSTSEALREETTMHINLEKETGASEELKSLLCEPLS